MWSYSGDPTTSTLDAVRFETADTDRTKGWTLQDAEIQYVLGTFRGNILLAAATCAEKILGRLKGTVGDKTIGPLRLTYNTATLKFYEGAACNLRQRANLQVTPWIGGTSKSEKRARKADPDLVQLKHEVDGLSHTGNRNETDSGTGQ